MVRAVCALVLSLLVVLAPSPAEAAATPERALQSSPSPAPPRTRLRAVSLVSLDRDLRKAGTQRRRPAELLSLGGLSKVLGYMTDRKTRDLIVFGEAEANTPPLQTQDFVVALRNSKLKYAAGGKAASYLAPSCSIDPNPEVIRELGEIGQRIAGSESAAQIEEALAQWQTACKRPQRVRVMGVPADTRFARVMVTADYHLKRLADGSEALSVPGFASLTELEVARSREEISEGRASHTSAPSFNRFWFHPGANRYAVDEDVVMINECPVVLLTEEQHLTRGGVAGAGRPDPLAGEFGQSFTAHYREIAAARPMYRELENLFRFVALAAIMKYRREPAKLGYLLDRFPLSQEEVPNALPGISNVKYVTWQAPAEEGDPFSPSVQGERSYQLWIPSCGGVSMDVKVTKASFAKPEGKRLRQLRKAALAARPSPRAVSWEFELP